MDALQRCPVCGGAAFTYNDVLWPELITAWQLTLIEVGYINRQQGLRCRTCNNNLRAMGLAAAILDELEFNGTLAEWCESDLPINVLEINHAGNLTGFLSRLSGHRLIEYPEFNMQELALPAESYDLVIHSDTLEHVSNPVLGLSECCRVLKRGGKCIFTIPIIVDRISRNRSGLPPSYHGNSKVPANDQIVHTEFGADFWKTVINAGFKCCGLYPFEYPAALVIVARK